MISHVRVNMRKSCKHEAITLGMTADMPKTIDNAFKRTQDALDALKDTGTRHFSNGHGEKRWEKG